jgi:hypothetical protein
MEIASDQKAMILQAYFEKIISKDDMKFILEVGTIVPPIPWMGLNEVEEKNQWRKRSLIEKIKGQNFIKIEWV